MIKFIMTKKNPPKFREKALISETYDAVSHAIRKVSPAWVLVAKATSHNEQARVRMPLRKRGCEVTVASGSVYARFIAKTGKKPCAKSLTT